MQIHAILQRSSHPSVLNQKAVVSGSSSYCYGLDGSCDELDNEELSPVTSLGIHLLASVYGGTHDVDEQEMSSWDDTNFPLCISGGARELALDDWEICNEVGSVTSLTDSQVSMDDFHFEPTLAASRLAYAANSVGSTSHPRKRFSYEEDLLEEEPSHKKDLDDENLGEIQYTLEDWELGSEDEPFEPLISAGSVGLYDSEMLFRAYQDVFDEPVVERCLPISKALVEHNQLVALQNLEFPQ